MASMMAFLQLWSGGISNLLLIGVICLSFCSIWRQYSFFKSWLLTLKACHLSLDSLVTVVTDAPKPLMIYILYHRSGFLSQFFPMTAIFYASLSFLIKAALVLELPELEFVGTENSMVGRHVIKKSLEHNPPILVFRLVVLEENQIP